MVQNKIKLNSFGLFSVTLVHRPTTEVRARTEANGKQLCILAQKMALVPYHLS